MSGLAQASIALALLLWAVAAPSAAALSPSQLGAHAALLRQNGHASRTPAQARSPQLARATVPPHWTFCVIAGLGSAFGLLAMGGGGFCLWTRWRSRQNEASTDGAASSAPLDEAMEEGGAAKALDVLERRRQQLSLDLEKLEEERARVLGETLGEPAKHEAAADDANLVPTLQDYDHLLKTTAKEVVQRVAPTFARGHALRGMMEKRVESLTAKTKSYILNEMNDAAGALCEAVDAPEAMLMLDLDAAMAANFPPAPVLLAGLLTPCVLQVNKLMHMLQLFFVLGPFAVLCTWALVVDQRHSCEAVPTIRPWLWMQCVLIYVLIASRVVLVAKIRSGQRYLEEQSVAARNRLQSRHGSLTNLRELFVSQVTLLQQVLLVEDGERRSIARHIAGWGTIVWLVLMIWCFWLVMRWLFIPGMLVYREGPIASERSPSDAANYCEAWATVLSARVSCFVWVLTGLFNAAAVLTWLTDQLVSSERFTRFVDGQARAFDKTLLGVPVAQLIVQAFILRSGVDGKSAELSLAVHERSMLGSDIESMEEKLNAMRQQMMEHDAKVSALKEVGGAVQNAEALEDSYNASLDVEVWRQRGSEAIEAAKAKVQALEKTRTEELEALARRIVEHARILQEDPNMQAVMEQFSEAAGHVTGRHSIHEMVDTAHEMVETAQSQVSSKVQEVMHSMETAPGVVKSPIGQAVGTARAGGDASGDGGVSSGGGASAY